MEDYFYCEIEDCFIGEDARRSPEGDRKALWKSVTLPDGISRQFLFVRIEDYFIGEARRSPEGDRKALWKSITLPDGRKENYENRKKVERKKRKQPPQPQKTEIFLHPLQYQIYQNPNEPNANKL